MESMKFVLAVCLPHNRFVLNEEELTFPEATQNAQKWIAENSNGDALVVHPWTMTIYWPERLRGKKVEFF